LRDWKDDTVHGVGGNLVTLADRKSGFLSTYPVNRRTSWQVTRAINLQLKGACGALCVNDIQAPRRKHVDDVG
jgi:hypothetical protein